MNTKNDNTTISEKVESLFCSQQIDWDLLAKNYDELNNAIYKEIVFDGFSMRLQYNPARIRSSTAKTDAVSIKERPCFLCSRNLPVVQRAVDYFRDYTILVNPFPIFNKHLTIACTQHTPQLIDGRIKDMLRMAIDMQDYVILYNGPQSGASAPDHLHFQAGTKGTLPIENDIRLFKGKKLLREDSHGTIFTMERYARKAIVFQSDNIGWLTDCFESLFKSLETLSPNCQLYEPMMNLIAFYEDSRLSLIVFPRIAHRPSAFYEKGERQIVFGPGTVDFGGLLILPRKEDFDKINRELIEKMLEELTWSDLLWEKLLQQTYLI